MRIILLALVLLMPAVTFSAEFNKVQVNKSKIAFVSKQMGVPIEGTFGKFDAKVSINPASAEKSRAQISIDLSSIDAGSSEANEEVKGRAWFDVAGYPTASFVSSSVKSIGAGKYVVSGKMTIKGKTVDMGAPFTLKEDKGTLSVEGVFTLKRLEFGIGSGVWSDTSVVADEVKIKFYLLLQ